MVQLSFPFGVVSTARLQRIPYSSIFYDQGVIAYPYYHAISQYYKLAGRRFGVFSRCATRIPLQLFCIQAQ